MSLNLQLNFFSFILVVAAIATIIISVLLIRRKAEASKYFGLMMLVLSVWAFAYGIELTRTELHEMLFWIKLEYVGVAFIPPLWLLFCSSFSGHSSWMNPRNIAFLFILPVITFLMVSTNSWHMLHYASVGVDTESGPFPLLAFEAGPWYWIHTIYFYVLLVIGTWMLILNFRNADPLYKRQTLVVLGGAFVPWLVNLLYLLGFKPYSHLDLTPIAFTFTGIIISFGLLQYRLFEIIPVAQDRLIENLPDGVMVLDDAERIVYCNHSMYEILGMEVGALVGRDVKDVFIRHPKVFRFITQRSNLKANVEIVVNGTEKVYEVTSTVLQQKKNINNGMVLLFYDVTELRHKEVALQQARLSAEESDRMKTAFLANMSHEIRNPLNAIIGFAGFLRDQETTLDDRTKYAKIIEGNAQHLLSLINDIIDISKIEAGELTVRYSTLSVSNLMNELSVMFEEVVHKKGLNFQLASAVPLSDDMIVTDALKLRQILVNLINNAIKFTDKGHIQVRVRKQQEILVFTVQDTGIGIKKDHLKQIFEPFRQSDVPVASGTGLGLSISTAYANRLGGSIEVESELGSGSTFTLKVPYIKADTSEETIHREEEMMDIEEPDWSDRTILLAEDEPVNVMYITVALKKTKVNLIKAQNGKEAVRLFSENPSTDLILMDIKMPEMDGFEASEAIRKLSPNVPIVALSGHAMVEQHKLDQAGITDLISKPVRKVDLIKGILRYMPQ